MDHYSKTALIISKKTLNKVGNEKIPSSWKLNIFGDNIDGFALLFDFCLLNNVSFSGNKENNFGDKIGNFWNVKSFNDFSNSSINVDGVSAFLISNLNGVSNVSKCLNKLNFRGCVCGDLNFDVFGYPIFKNRLLFDIWAKKFYLNFP